MLLFLTFVEKEEDKQILEKIYYQYREPLFYVAKNILKDHHLAEDALQNMFIKLARYLKKGNLPTQDKIGSFLAVMIKHTAIDLHRQQWRQRETLEISEEVFPQSVHSALPGPEEILLNQEAYQQVVAFIRTLSPDHQKVLFLRYFCERTEQEIADLLEIKRELVNSRLFRARNKLKEILAKEGEKNE